VLVLVGFIVLRSGGEEVTVETTEATLPVVTVATVSDLRGTSEFRVIGTVRSASEARLETEAGGRVTDVLVSLGDRVSAGTVLARLENSREQVALRQAEAAYEAALASSLQGTASQDEAVRGVQNAYRTAYTTVDDVVRSTVDDFYSNPDGAIVGVRLSKGDTLSLRTTRKDLERTLDDWAATIASGYRNQNSTQLLAEADATIRSVGNLLITLSTLSLDEPVGSPFLSADTQTELTRARATLDGALAALAQARTVYEQATLTVRPDQPSAVSAQLKSAAASVESARIALEKTLVRSPISGVVNSLSLVAGSFVSPGTPAAVVANNAALEVTTALAEADLATVRVGDTVRLDAVGTGTVTALAPAIDTTSGKGEVIIGVASDTMLVNGSTVGVRFNRTLTGVAADRITIPLTAIRLLPSGPIAFSVSEKNTLVVVPVTVGELFGDRIEILSGLSLSDRIITDARGRKDGDAVTVSQ
jgi:RND family efflux transporter MFP subunit